MAVRELHKPARRACDHVTEGGCSVHSTRPESCRAFNCLWLRGGVGEGDAHRPDQLGIVFDGYVERPEGTERWFAFALWEGAFESVEARPVLDALAGDREVVLSYRDGRFSRLGPGE